MFLAQLAAFLIHHHHAWWGHHLTHLRHRQFLRALRWAVRHGFRYQP